MDKDGNPMSAINCQNKVYFEGCADNVIKIGRAKQSTRKRRSQRARNRYVAAETLLAAIQTDASSETYLKRHFAHLLIDGETEYFRAEPELTEYVYWLRDQHFTWLSDEDGPDDIVGYEAFHPTEQRRRTAPQGAGQLVEDWDVLEPMPYTTDLRGTPFAWMAQTKPTFNDYYTPPWLINLAREGMGGIDLDPATHWTANKVHKIPHFYTRNHDAHKQPWFGRVWLNPPYGENKPWFDDVVTHWDKQAIEQVCFLSPAWAFNTIIAKPLMARASLVLLLTCNTAMFWGWGKRTPDRPEIITRENDCSLGSNHPHLIVYLGDRANEMAAVFAESGQALPLLTWDHEIRINDAKRRGADAGAV